MVKLGCFSQLNRYWYRSQNAEKKLVHLSPETMFCVFSKYHRLVGRGVGPCLYCPYTILQCFVSFLNTPAAADSSTSLCLYCPYTIFQKLCFMSFLNMPSARPQSQGSTLFNVYHTEESPIDFLFFLLVDRFSFPFFLRLFSRLLGYKLKRMLW